MKDGLPIIGKEITYNNKLWTINQFHMVQNNPELYVELYDGWSRLNVMWSNIRPILEKRGLGDYGTVSTQQQI